MKSYLTIAALFATLPVLAQNAPKNIIFMIGDGMGPAYTSAYRYYQDTPKDGKVKRTIFDQLQTGMAMTYPNDSTIVTDSAAGATALSTGHKTYNGAIAVNTKREDLPTMLELAKRQGMTTALVATSQINHATPASFAAHNNSRKNYNQIADDYIDNKIAGKLPVDLMLGGGTEYFIRPDRNLVQEFKDAGYQYSDNLNALASVNQVPALGLYAKKGLPYAIDSDPKRLTKMTEKALELLKNNSNDFFIMIEGSQIDWCGHANDIACAMTEMDDFAHAITLAKQYVDNHPDTLLVVTADHSTGGLTLGADRQYLWKADKVKAVKASLGEITKGLSAVKDPVSAWKNYVDFSLTNAQKAQLTQAHKQGEKALMLAVKNIINTTSYTGWTTGGHTAVDVPVLAYGKGAAQFNGLQNNTDIAKSLLEFIAK